MDWSVGLWVTMIGANIAAIIKMIIIHRPIKAVLLFNIRNRESIHRRLVRWSSIMALVGCSAGTFVLVCMPSGIDTLAFTCFSMCLNRNGQNVFGHSSIVLYSCVRLFI